MSGLWRYGTEKPEGKYLVKRRDGTVPEWPYFVIGAKDPCAAVGLLAYADEAERQGFDPQYVHDVRQMAVEFQQFLSDNGAGDPDGKPHRKDDPDTVAEMANSKGA